MRFEDRKPIADRQFTAPSPGLNLRGRCWHCDKLGTEGFKKRVPGLLRPTWVCRQCAEARGGAAE